MVRLARAFDHRESDERERAFCRIATAVAKYWLCKRAPVHVGEALECLGGNGYVEESIMPRLYREAPLYSIWEGSGNVMCLDVLRALTKDHATLEALLAELKTTAGADERLDAYVAGISTRLNAAGGEEHSARVLTEKLSLALQASLMVRYSSPAIAEAYIASRLAGQHGHAFGTLPEEMDVKEILNGVVEPLAMEK
jgi:putative acyl-CoA dehydrogenase